MLNQIVLVGRLVQDPKKEELENEVTKSVITLAIPRAYKNADGVYDTDFVDCILWKGIAENTIEYCKKGDLVGIKGRIQSRKVDDKNVVEIVAEKVTFLSSRKEDNKGE